MKSFYMTILAITVTATGCSDGSDAVPLNQFGNELAQTICEKEFDCCPQDSAAEYVSVEACVSEAQVFTAFLTAALQASQDAGRSRYDGARAGECLDLLRGFDCTALQQVGGEFFGCEAFIVPLVDAGGACDQDFECTTGYCYNDGASELGACDTLPGVGQACEFDCVEGAYCDFGTSLCAATKADGSECVFNDECQSYFCDDSTGAGVCASEDLTCS